jgi:hypothetical protein
MQQSNQVGDSTYLQWNLTKGGENAEAEARAENNKGEAAAIARDAPIGPVGEMPQYIINLDRRTDRMAVTVPKLRSFGFTGIERWPATDSRLMSRAEVDGLVRPEARAPIWINQRTQHPCGKQHFREIATPDWVSQFTNLVHS